MKKRKEIWSLGLYKESLRRIRIPAVIFFVIITVSAVLIPLSSVISRSKYSTDILQYAPSVTAISANPVLVVCILIAALALTYTAFSFLNKRNSSDLYASMPHTRLAMYTSRITALVTVIASMILITTGVSALMLKIFDKYFIIKWSSFFPYMAGCFAAAMLICAVFSIAMSITGTVLNNVIVAGLIMYLPRTVLTIVISSVNSKFPLIVDGYISDILAPGINILTGFLDRFYFSYSKSLLTPSSQIYTLCLAVVYFVIGAVLFVRRKSESAERAAPTPFMQSVYRILLTMVVCLIPCGLIFNIHKPDSHDVFVIVCYYIVALLVYLFYELLTTKKWKNLVKCLPGLVIVLILNLALIGSMYGLYYAEVSFTPDADEVEYVSLVNGISGDYAHDGLARYIIEQEADIRITDRAAIEAVTESLKANVEHYRKTGQVYSYLEQSISYVGDKAKPSPIQCIVKIKTDLTVKYRVVYMDSVKHDIIEKKLEETEAYRNMWLTLPDPASDSVNADLGYRADEKDALELFEVLKDEVSRLDLDVWKEYLKSNKSSFATFTYVADGFYVSVPIDPSVLPESAQLAARIRNRNCPFTPQEVKDALAAGDVGTGKKFILNNVEYLNGNGATFSADRFYKNLAKYIDTEAELELSKGCLCLNIMIPEVDGSYSHSYLYVHLNETGEQQFYSYIEK